MFTAGNAGHKLSLALVALLLGGLTARAGGDEAKLLPAGSHLFVSFQVPTFLKSKTFAAVQKKSAPAAQKIASAFAANLGVASDNIERLLIGLDVPPIGSGRHMFVVTTKKPVTFAAILANLEPPAQSYAWKEIKVAAFTIHQPGANPGPTQSMQPFCVVADKVVLHGTLASLKAILQRKQAPALAAGMRTGLKEAGPDNALSIVIDFQQAMAEAKEDKLPIDVLFPDAEALQGVHVLAIKVNETDKVTATATFLCKDAAAAVAVERMLHSVRDSTKNMTAPVGKLPPAQQAKAKAIHTLVEAVRISRADNRVSAALTVEPAVVADLLLSLTRPLGADEAEDKAAAFGK